MPRQPRIDAPGLVHHVYTRGIDKCRIFLDDGDRDFFLRRLGDLVVDTGNPIYAFALLPNHFHLLIRHEKAPLATFMQRLLTSYAIYYNKKQGRNGHLFQNRYKSIPCGDEVHFAELLRYIHLNPVRAGLCSFLELTSFRYCGHGCLTGNKKLSWLNTEIPLSLFGDSPKQARIAYRKFVEAGLSSVGETLSAAPQIGEAVEGVGDTDDVNRIITDSGRCLIYEKNKIRAEESAKISQLIDEVCLAYDITRNELFSKSKRRMITKARACLAQEMSSRFGLTRSQIAAELTVQPAAVGKMISRKR